MLCIYCRYVAGSGWSRQQGGCRGLHATDDVETAGRREDTGTSQLMTSQLMTSHSAEPAVTHHWFAQPPVVSRDEQSLLCTFILCN